MGLSAATLLLLGCFTIAISANAQLDSAQDLDDTHLRLSGSRQAQYSQGTLQGSTAAYVGLGTAAEAALGDAEQVASVLLADDASIAGGLMPVSASRKHRRVNKHSRHSHKRKTPDIHDTSSSHDRKDSDHHYDPSHEDHALRLTDSYSRDKTSEGFRSSSPTRYPGPKPSAPKGYSAPTEPLDEDTYEDNGGRKKYKKQQQRGGSGSGGDDWFTGGPSSRDDPYDGDSYHEGMYKRGAGGSSDYHSPGEGYPGSGYTPLAPSKNVCKQVLLEEEEVEVVFTPNKDKATITTLLGTCANPNHQLPTLGGGCVVECQDVADLCSITQLNSHVFAAPANFKSMDNYYPVMCSYRADAPLKAGCNIVMKVACCSDVPKAETDDADKGAKGKTSSGRKAVTKNAAYNDDSDEDDDEPEEYYAIVRSKLLRIPLTSQKY